MDRNGRIIPKAQVAELLAFFAMRDMVGKARGNRFARSTMPKNGAAHIPEP